MRMGGRSVWPSRHPDRGDVVVGESYRPDVFRAGDPLPYVVAPCLGLRNCAPPNGSRRSSQLSERNKVVAFWTRAGERGLGSSFLLGGVGAGGILAPLVLSRVAQGWGWRSSFVLCGAVAAVIAFCWYVFATDRPEQHPRINSAELALITAS